MMKSSESAPMNRVRRTIPPGYAYAAALPVLGGCKFTARFLNRQKDNLIADALYRKLKTGSFAPPQLSVGAQGSLGLGPLSLGGKIGLGAGGYPGEGETAYYQPLSEQGLDHHVAGELGLGAGVTTLNVGAGAGAALNNYDGGLPSIPSIGVPQFIKYIIIIILARNYNNAFIVGTFPGISARFPARLGSVLMTMWSMWSLTPMITRAGSRCPNLQAGAYQVCLACRDFPPSPRTLSRLR